MQHNIRDNSKQTRAGLLSLAAGCAFVLAGLWVTPAQVGATASQTQNCSTDNDGCCNNGDNGEDGVGLAEDNGCCNTGDNGEDGVGLAEDDSCNTPDPSPTPVTCGEGYHKVGETCVPDDEEELTCNEDEHVENDECVPDDEEELTCNEDEHVENDECVPDDEEELTCNEDEHVENDECVPDDEEELTCNEDEHVENDECVPNEENPPAECEESTGGEEEEDAVLSQFVTRLFDGENPEVDDEHCLEDIEIVGVCAELDANNKDTAVEWFTLHNPNTTAVTVEWADGSITIDADETVTVSTAGPGIELSTTEDDGEEDEETYVIGSADSPEDTCTREVDVTKVVEGDATEGTDFIYVVTFTRGTSTQDVELTAGETKTITLPGSLYEEDAFSYDVTETTTGGASVVTQDVATLDVWGHGDLKNLSVEVTNWFAAISIDKSASVTTAQEGDEYDYTLQVRNTGALDLDVTVTDELPVGVTYVSSSVAGAAGSCANVDQLVTCTFDADIAAGEDAPEITITVVADALANDTEVTNTAKAVGFFAESNVQPIGTLEVLPAELTCSDIDTSVSVCDLSDTVVTGLTVIPTDDQNTPGDTSGSGANLPETGSDSSSLLLTLGALLLGLGTVVLVAGRKPAVD